MSEPQKSASFEDLYSVPEDSSGFTINEKLVKSAIKHFLELNASFSMYALIDALKKE